MKELNTLLEDCYDLFRLPHKMSAENLEKFSANVAAKVKEAIEEASNSVEDEQPYLRMSKIGTPDRKLWYEFNVKKSQRSIDPATRIKFLYGDILEELLILFAKEAGHSVEGEQGELEILGVPGHRDCKIDGITVDVKSASKFAFTKFADGSLAKNDSFGYIAQISGYAKADKSPYAAFFVINKETGELALMKVDQIDMIDPAHRINHIQQNVLTRKEAPVEKCYQPEPLGKSGNMTLHKNCTYCSYQSECWKNDGIRRFKYSDGIKSLTKVVELPRVEEVK